MIEINGLGHLLSLINRHTCVTVIDFYADWCGPCQQIKPEYERMAQYFDASTVSFCKCNVDRHRDCASHFRITAMPTFVVCLGGETITTIRGGDLGALERNVNIALAQIKPTSGQQTSNTAQEPPPPGAQHAFAEAMLKVARSKYTNNPIEEKDSCDLAYKMLSEEKPFGFTLIPYLASDAFSSLALESLFKNITSRAPPHCDDHTIAINQVLRHVVEWATAVTWDDIPMVTRLHQVLLALARCPATQSLLVQSVYFDSDIIENGWELQRHTVLGAIMGVGPEAMASMMGNLSRTNAEWHCVLNMFPPEEADTHGQTINEIQQKVELLAEMNTRLVKSLLQARPTRDATLRFLGRALQLNEDYQKTMHQSSPISSRYFFIQLQSVLVEVAVPIFQRDFEPSSIPAVYLLPDLRNHAVVSFGQDVERVQHFSEESPLPPFPSGMEPYKPTVHLFFLAARALTLCATVFIDEHDRDARSATHPQSPPSQRAAFTAEKCLYEGLLGSAALGRSRLEFLNGLANWLLHQMGVHPDGTLPPTPPTEWSYLPQQLVDCVIHATQMAPVDSLYIDGMISLMLVLMGNTTYIPKPHTHALFPDYLISLLDNAETRRTVEAHAWFSEHVVRACMHCYIAVEKAIYEKVQARYGLSHCIENFLQSDSLCRPVRDEFEKEGTVLERFSHMAVAEVNESVDQLIQNLTKMNELVKSGADLSETAAQRPASATAADPPMNTNTGRGPEAEEEEEQGDGTQTYHQLGVGLRMHIMLFNASIDMFIELSVQFPRGVSQNLVAQQISQMLSRSLVTFAGPQCKNLKIENADKYEFNPREVLSRLVDCLTHFRRSQNFVRCMCQCGIPTDAILDAMRTILERQLVPYSLLWKLSELRGALQAKEKEVDDEEAVWDDAPDFALDVLLSTPLLHPVALPAEVKDLADLVYVNRDTVHHLLLSESKHPFTKEYLDERMVEAFNDRPDVAAAREKVQQAIKKWLREAKQNKGTAK